MPKLIDSVADIYPHSRGLQDAGKRVGFVPTMGALHDGHLSLVREAFEQCDHVVVSIFVNPKQFGADEDLDRYPRTLADDTIKLSNLPHPERITLYAPTLEEMYPKNYATSIQVSGLTEAMCGKSRPNFFGGIVTVVTKLLLQVQPHVVFFGEKDYQQLKIVQRLAKDLNLPVDVVGCPIRREDDGLAMSSRNQYLTTQERALAPILNQTLIEMSDHIRNGMDVLSTLEAGRDALTLSGFNEIDYLDYRDGESLASLSHYRPHGRLLVGAYLGKTRLLDNIEV